MTQLKDSMSNIEKIRQEIERLKTTNPSEYNYNNAKGYIWAMDDILSFINSLPGEIPPYCTGFKGDPDPPGISELEEAAARYERENRQSILSSVDIVNAFIEGAEWQNEQMMDEWLKDRDGCFWDGVNEGKKAMENQMPQPEDTVIFQKGVEEGRRLERDDFALTWQDMAKIDAIILNVNNEFAVDYTKEIDRQKFYEEVLKRFKEV